MWMNNIYIFIRSVLLALIAFLFISCTELKIDGLILLSNNEIEIGILPEVGGRIVLLRKPGKENFLKSDSTLWKNANKLKPKISPYSDFIPYNGHITWVGPQDEWWIHQELNIERKKNKADWPPDPYIIYGKYDIIEKTDNHIKLAGTVSPICGLSMIKEYSISETGKVTIKVTAKNNRDEPVRWDLWMLTRLDGFSQAYVPIDKNGIIDLVINSSERVEITPYQINNNHFTFNPSLPSNDKMQQVQEVHLYPSQNYIAGFSRKQMLLIRFDKLVKKNVHPSHGLVELYSSVNKSGDDTLLELEVHGAYKTLLAGETMSLTETWELYNYDGDSNKQRQFEFLQNHK